MPPQVSSREAPATGSRKRGSLPATLAIALLLTGAVGGWSERLGLPDNRSEGFVRVGALLGALVVGVWLFSRSRNQALAESSTGQRPPSEMAPERLELPKLVALQTEAASLVEDARHTVALFADMVADPERYRTRVSETIDVEGRIVRQTVSTEFRLRGIEKVDPHLYIPVLQPSKGELIDHFHIRDGSDTFLVDLTYAETIRLAAAGLRLLVLQAAEHEGRPPSVLSDDVRAGELALLDLIARRGPMDETRTEQLLTEAVEGLRAHLTNDVARERMRRYVLKMSMSYPIVAVLPSESLVDGRALLRYSRTVVPVSHRPGWRGTLRLGLGLRPYQVALPVTLAFTTGSYHMRVNGPPGTYLYGRYLRCRHCRFLVTSKWGPSTEPPDGDCRHKDGAAPQLADRHYRVQRRRGQNFVHVYMRGYANRSAKLSDVELIARFKETPPGSRARAAMTALVATLIIGVIGYRLSTNDIPSGSDLPTLILAIPVVASTWFGLEQGDSFVGQSLLGRISLAVTTVISLAAVAVYYVDPAERMGVTGVWSGMNLLGVVDPFWAALCIASAVNMIYVSYRFVLRLSFYVSLLRKPDALGAGYSQG